MMAIIFGLVIIFLKLYLKKINEVYAVWLKDFT